MVAIDVEERRGRVASRGQMGKRPPNKDRCRLSEVEGARPLLVVGGQAGGEDAINNI